jgi:hypothetical protein
LILKGLGKKYLDDATPSINLPQDAVDKPQGYADFALRYI